MIHPVLDFENSNFGIVSHFDIRHSDFSYFFMVTVLLHRIL